MHVAIVNYPYPPTAQTPDQLLDRFAVLVDWAAALRAAGARVTVFQRARHAAERERAGVGYRLFADGGGPLPRAWELPGGLHRAVAAARPTVVHLHGQIFPLQTWALRRALPAGSALIVQDHGGEPPAPRGPLRVARLALLRRGLASAHGLMFTAAAMAEPWRAAGLIRPTQRIYAVIEASTRLRPPADPAPRLPGDPALLWVGRLHPVKDPLTALEGFARALPALPGAALTMVYGSDELLGAVRERAARPDLAGRVQLRGRVEQAALPALYAGADGFLLGSRREAAGFALLEAMACGLPPLVPDIPPFRAITGGAVGALWPPGDADGCAAAIRSLAASARGAARAATLARFAQALTWAAIGRTALAAYHDLAEYVCASR